MTKPLPEIPKQWIKGLVPTLNDKGFMFEVLDEFADEFIRLAGEGDAEALEIGCAYGVATIAALQAGATVTACDMDRGHLEVLKSRVPENLMPNLKLKVGTLPDIDLPQEQFGYLLCSRVLHFLTGEEVEQSVQNMYRWLRPGGHLFLVADTPWGIWRNFIPTWEENLANNERWPGLMIKPVNYLPYEPSSDDIGPPIMNLLDPDLLTRTCAEAGFEVRKAAFIDRSDFGDRGRMDGRENCGIHAFKPLA